MASSKNPPEKRDYRHEYDSYHGKPEQIKKRAQRNAAHAAVEKASGKNISSDVDHGRPIRKGGTNSPGNLQVTSVAKNRSWRAGKKGYD